MRTPRVNAIGPASCYLEHAAGERVLLAEAPENYIDTVARTEVQEIDQCYSLGDCWCRKTDAHIV